MTQLEKIKANFKAIKASWEVNIGGFPLSQERKEILNAFTGWGGCKAVLCPLDKEWSKDTIGKEHLKVEKEVKKGYKFLCETFGERVAKNMWESIRSATLTSFFTPTQVPDALFEEMKRQKPVEGIEMLDPCAGGGAYIDACLKYFPNAKVTAVEKDAITAFILKAKYSENSNVTVHNKGFEEVKFKDKKFDVIASNIPFGDFKVAFTQANYDKIFTNKIHNFFFYHSQNLLKEKGILSFITSTGVFNSAENTPVRKSLIEQGKILDLKVLPNNTFEDTATSSHIITYVKNQQEINPEQELFLNTTIDENGVQLNNYILPNKEKVYLQTPVLGTNQYGKPEYTYKIGDFNKAIEQLKEDWTQIDLGIHTQLVPQEENILEPFIYPTKKIASFNEKQNSLVEELQYIRKGNIPEGISNFKVIANIRARTEVDKTIPLITIATAMEKGKKMYYIQSDLKHLSFTPLNERWINTEQVLPALENVFEQIQNLSQEYQMPISLDLRRDSDGNKFNEFFQKNYKHAKLEYGYIKKLDFKFHREPQEKDIFVTKKGNIAQIVEIQEIVPEINSEFPQKSEGYKIKQIEVSQSDKEKLVGLLNLYADYNEFIEKHIQYKKGVEWKLEQLEEAQQKINQSYDTFVAKYGTIGENEKFIKKYSEVLKDCASVIKSLEIFEEEKINPSLPLEGDNIKQVYKKSGIFSYNYSEDFNEIMTTEVALVKSFSKNGKIDIPYIAQLTSKEENTIFEELADIIIKNPITKEYELKESFLQGDLYNKKEAIEALPNSNDREEALEFLQQYFPDEISFYEIKYQFGSRWIPIEYYKEFIQEQIKSPFSINYKVETDNFLLNVNPNEINREFFLRKKMGNGLFFTSEDVIKHAFYGTYPQITTSEKYTIEGGKEKKRDIILYEDTAYCKRQIDNFKQQFEKYINNLPKEKKEKLSYVYNRKFNYLAKNVEINNSFFKLGINTQNLGISKEYPHQINGVWKMLLNNGGVIDHEVGYGKTISLIALAHNLKKFKKAKLPLILGLPANISEIAKRYQQAYPQDRILYAGKNEFSPVNRELFFNQLRNNEYDVVIMSHEQFKEIPVSDEIYLQEIEKEIKNLESNLKEAKEDDLSPKDYRHLEITIENQKAKCIQLKENIESGKNKNIPHIENLGIDHIIVDESHAFKNGKFSTRHNRTKGIGDTKGSVRAEALKMAIRSIQKNNKSDFGATFFSGTPISNSLSELYILQNYLCPNMLEEKGIANFDSWASTFMLKNQEIESNIVGEAVVTERFRKYMNVPELSRMYRAITHTMRGDSEFVQRPQQQVGMLVNELTPQQKKFNAKLLSLMKSMGGKKEEERLKLEEPLKRDKLGNISALSLQITNLAWKASLDMRMINKNLPDDPNSKVNLMIEKVLYRYNRYKDMQGTQIIFCDKSVSYKKLSYEQMDYNYKNNIFTSIYDDIKYKLIKRGIPENEIAFIQDYNTDKKKMQLSKLMNEGKIRFLIGGIQNAGTGINVQKRLCGVTHLTLPWRPSDLEQGNGRIFRAGNEIARLMNDNKCEIDMCATNGTLDTYKTEFLRRKINFINQIREGANSNIRVIDEGEMGEDMALDLATLQAELAGDQTILEKAKVDKELEELNKIINDFDIQRRKAQDKLEINEKEKKGKEKIISYIERDIKKAESLVQYKGDKKINAPIIPELGEIFNEKILAEYLKNKINEVRGYSLAETFKVGELYGFDMILKRNFNGVTALLASQEEPKMEYENNRIENLWDATLSDTVICNSFINCFSIMEKRLNDNKKFFEKYDTEVKSAQLELKETLSQELVDRQKELSKRQEELEKKLKETGGLRTKANYQIIQENFDNRYLNVIKITEDIKELERAILYDQFGPDMSVAHIYIPNEEMLNLFLHKFNNNGITLKNEGLWNDQQEAYYLSFTIDDVDLWFETFENIFHPRKELPRVELELPAPFQEDNKQKIEKQVQNKEPYTIDKDGQLTFSFDDFGTNNQDTNISKEASEEEVQKVLEDIRGGQEQRIPTVFEENTQEKELQELPQWQCPDAYKDFPPLYATEEVPLEERKVYTAFYIPGLKGTFYLNELDPLTGDAFGLVAGEEVEWGYFSIDEIVRAGAVEINFGKPLSYKELLDTELKKNLEKEELKNIFNGKLLFEEDRWQNLPDEEENSVESEKKMDIDNEWSLPEEKPHNKNNKKNNF